jgi:hypothetical protein
MAVARLDEPISRQLRWRSHNQVIVRSQQRGRSTLGSNAFEPFTTVEALLPNCLGNERTLRL